EATAHTGAVVVQELRDVPVRLRRVVEAAAVVLVHPVTPLVADHSGDLAGVVAAVAVPVHVQLPTAPGRVAGAVDVRVDLRLGGVQPGTPGDPGAGVLLQ